ncbi:MAG: hypothetical protein N6V49_01310 [Serratia symbiotica]|nr:hypothetical protein [Serratia symbiotica]
MARPVAPAQFSNTIGQTLHLLRTVLPLCCTTMFSQCLFWPSTLVKSLIEIK